MSEYLLFSYQIALCIILSYFHHHIFGNGELTDNAVVNKVKKVNKSEAQVKMSMFIERCTK